MQNKKYKVLYVDDEEINLRAFKNDFRRDFSVYTANSAQGGLQILDKEDIPVIISDQRMPEMSGIELLKRAKQKWPKIKRIILTAYADLIVLKEAINEDVLWWYVNKPYNYENFKSVLEKAIETYKLESDKEILNKELDFRNEMLEKMMNTALDGIITIDDKHEIIKVNNAANKLFEYKPDELLGKALNMLIPENKKAKHTKHVNTFAEIGSSSRVMGNESTITGKTSSGKTVPLEISISKLKVKDGHYYTAFIRDISARLLAENKLQESEAKLKEAQKIAFIGHWTRNHQIKDDFNWSDEMFRILGWAPGEIEATAENFYSSVHPDDYANTRKTFNDSLASMQPYSINYRLQLRDGQIKYVNEKCITQFDKQGKPIQSTATIQDITQQVEADLALKNSEEKFRSFTESLKISVLLIQDKKIKYANKECQLLLEYTKEELLDLTYTKYIHPDALSLVTTNHENCIESKKGVSQFETKVVSRSNQVKDVFVTQVKIDFQDNPALLVTYLDVTNKKQIEEQLIRSEERFKLAMKGANDGLWDWNVETNAVYFSPRWKGILGYKDSEINNDLASWKNLLHPDNLRYTEQEIDNFIKGIVQKFEIEYRMKHKDGTYRHILSRAFGIRSTSGEVIRIVGTHVDTTERRKIEEKIKNLNQNLEQLVKNRTEELTVEKDFSNNIINALPGLFSLIDMKGNIVRWNNNHEAVTGYSAEEYKKMMVYDFFSEAAKTKILKEQQQLQKKGKISLETTLLTKSGQEIPYFFSGIKIKIDNKNYIVGTGIDISLRKKAEDELLAKSKELELFNNAMTNREMRIIEMKEEVNKLAVQFGKSPPYDEIWKDKN